MLANTAKLLGLGDLSTCEGFGTRSPIEGFEFSKLQRCCSCDKQFSPIIYDRTRWFWQRPMSPLWSSLEEEQRSSIPMSPPPSSPPSHPMSPLLSSLEEEHPPSERATPEVCISFSQISPTLWYVSAFPKLGQHCWILLQSKTICQTWACTNVSCTFSL